MLTTVTLTTTGLLDLVLRGWTGDEVGFLPILFVAFAMAARDTSFVNNGEVSVPLSYRHPGQDGPGHRAAPRQRLDPGVARLRPALPILRHRGRHRRDHQVVITGPQMLLVEAAAISAALTAYTYHHASERHPEDVSLLS